MNKVHQVHHVDSLALEGLRSDRQTDKQTDRQPDRRSQRAEGEEKEKQKGEPKGEQKGKQNVRSKAQYSTTQVAFGFSLPMTFPH